MALKRSERLSKKRRHRAGRPRKQGQRFASGGLIPEKFKPTDEVADRRKAAVIGVLKAYERGDLGVLSAIKEEDEVSVSLNDPLGILRERHDRGREAIGISPGHHHFGVQYSRLRAMFGRGQAKISTYGDSRFGDIYPERGEDPIDEWRATQTILSRTQRRVLDLTLIDGWIPDATDHVAIAALRDGLEALADGMNGLYPQIWEAFRDG